MKQYHKSIACLLLLFQSINVTALPLQGVLQWIGHHKLQSTAGFTSALALYRYLTRNTLYGYENHVDSDIRIRFQGQTYTLNELNTDTETSLETNSVFLFLHGLDEHKAIKKGQRWAQRAPHLPYVSFNFVDGEHPSYTRRSRDGVRQRNVKNQVLNATKGNFAQLPDVLRAILVLKKLHAHGIKTVNFLGWCRGGGTVLNMLAVLSDTTGTYDAALNRIGVKDTTRAALIAMIERGKHVFSCPLLDVRVPLKTSALEWPLGLLSRYNPWGLRAIESVKKLHNLNLNAIIHFQRHDDIVKNVYDEQLITEMRRASSGSIQVIYDDGQHLSKTPKLDDQLAKFFT